MDPLESLLIGDHLKITKHVLSVHLVVLLEAANGKILEFEIKDMPEDWYDGAPKRLP